MEGYIRKCPSVVRQILNEEKSRRNTLVLSTSLLPITNVFTRGLNKNSATVAVVVDHGSMNEDLRLRKNAQLRVIMRCQESEIKEMLRIFNFTEFYVVIDSHLNLVGSKFQSFLKCFVHTIDHVAKRSGTDINFFTFSRKSKPRPLGNAHARDESLKRTSTNATQLKFSCTENVLSSRSMAGIFMSSVNMYLRTFKNLYNLQTGFGTDVYYLPHITIHS